MTDIWVRCPSCVGGSVVVDVDDPAWLERAGCDSCGWRMMVGSFVPDEAMGVRNEVLRTAASVLGVIL